MTSFAHRVSFAVAFLASVTLALAQPPKPVDVPPAAEIKAAVDTLKDVFDKLYAGMDGSPNRIALAKKLLDVAPNRKTPAMVYACYDEARRIAAANGDATTALAATEELRRRFTKLPDTLLRETLQQLSKAALEVPQAATLAKLASEEARTALDRQDYAGAAELIGLAVSFAKTAEDPDLALDLREYKTKLDTLKKAADTLKQMPADPAANSTLGEFWAFERGNWAVGLKHLAKGSDKPLATVAALEATNPKTTQDRTALGEQWHKLSNAAQGDRKRVLAERAWEWYSAAVAVATGDADLKPSVRAKEIEAAFPDLFNKVFEGHTAAVAAIAMTPDGKTLVSAGNDGSVRVWDAATGQLLRKIDGHEGWVGNLLITPDGEKLITAGGDNVIRVWDVATGKQVGMLEGHKVAIRGLALTADGKQLVSGASDKTIRLWDMAELKFVRKFGPETESVESVAITADGSRIFAGNDAGVVTVFDATTGEVVSKFDKHGGTMVYTITVTKDGKTALSGARDKVIRIWDVATGKELRTLTGHTEQVYQIVLSRDEKQVLSGSFDKTVRLWDFASGKELRKYEGHTDGVQGVCYGAGERTVFSASWDKTVRRWRVAAGGK